MSIIRRIIAATLSVGLLLAAVWAVVYRQQIIDHVKVWQYQPSQQIRQIAERAGMNQQGMFYFYATHPQIESAEEFNTECRRVEQASPILGCYDQGSDSIYIYNVTDPELDGIKEVTAAHEMLHAAFARLSEAEQRQLGQLLEQAYSRLSTKALDERMAYYDRAQPGSRSNELHSIIGTEFADIGPELEQYYRRYFANRAAVVALHDQYSHRFEQTKSEADTLHAGLQQQKPALEQAKSGYVADLNACNQQVEQFNQRARRGEFSSQAQFQVERSQIVTQANQLQVRRAELEAKIATYNADVARLNQLGRQIDKLNNSLDSTKAVK